MQQFREALYAHRSSEDFYTSYIEETSDGNSPFANLRFSAVLASAVFSLAVLLYHCCVISSLVFV